MGVSTSAPQDGEALDTAELLELGRAAGLSAVGVTTAGVQQPARDLLHLRKRAGRAGDMDFTYRNPDRSTDPRSVLPSARSVIAGAWSYAPWVAPPTDDTVPIGQVARYAWRDHYADLRAALEAMAVPLRAAGNKAVVVADTNGLVDRNAAWSAGLGWYGKNANLLLPEAGSWFVLGAVVTNAELVVDATPQPDGCGSCSRCMDDCPTGAIVGPGIVDAARCLAWLVQADGAFPLEWRVSLGDRIYGCDDCQEVCPPNRTATSLGPKPVAERGQAAVDLIWLLSAPDEEILARHGRWYIAKRNVDNVRRSALIALGNTAAVGHHQVIETLDRYLEHPEPILRGHAVWAARRLGLEHLASRAADDPDTGVRDELLGEVEARYAATDWEPEPDREELGDA